MAWKLILNIGYLIADFYVLLLFLCDLKPEWKESIGISAMKVLDNTGKVLE